MPARVIGLRLGLGLGSGSRLGLGLGLGLGLWLGFGFGLSPWQSVFQLGASEEMLTRRSLASCAGGIAVRAKVSAEAFDHIASKSRCAPLAGQRGTRRYASTKREERPWLCAMVLLNQSTPRLKLPRGVGQLAKSTWLGLGSGLGLGLGLGLVGEVYRRDGRLGHAREHAAQIELAQRHDGLACLG